jgi:DNA-binding transcriptional ArsR family regulator
LRKSRERRESYFALLSEVWAIVSPWWETAGLRSLESAIVDVEKKLSSGVPWYDIIAPCAYFEERRPGVIERYEGGKPVRLAPCAFFGQSLYFEFPDSILIGFGVESAANSAKSRASSAIRPLRALADPTRLAIFEFLKLGPSTVKDVSESFSLSQPTVSVHVKRLREVGLVNATRQGTQFTIDINWVEADKVSDALREVLSR